MRLITFGRPHIARSGGQEVALQPLQVAVVAYLAVAGPRDRDHLAELFWHDNKNRLNSLSTTLNRIRVKAPDSVWLREKTLVGTDLVSDVSELRDAIDRADFESVTRLYRAPFLGSLRLRRQNLEFEEWMLETRATLASTVELALLQRGRHLYDAGEHLAAAIAAEEAWEIAIRDGFPSPDYFEAYHRILASAGRPSANAVRTMAEEFGTALPPVEPIVFESNTEPAQVESPALQSSIGRHAGAVGTATQLFGCEEELDAIASSVASQRLTTVVGLGGSGKTRLAAEFFNSVDTQQDFPHRYWVDLRDVGDRDLVAPTIAASLGQRFDDLASLADRLTNDQPALLVLDNFEHVLDAAGVAEELSSSNSAIRVLVTSRVPLEVAAESVVQLNGLDTSDDELESPAEQLFMSSARRAGVSDNRLNGSGRSAVRDVCRRVGGNPLALEIAGGWAQILLPAEILKALSLGNELLGSQMVGDLRAMNTVLSQSWSTLAATDQHTLMLLATFPSGCLTTEALELEELPIRSIGRLVQHSLVRMHVEGRITLHPLIEGHALSELEQRPDLNRKFHEVLSNWCSRFAAAIGSKTNETSPTLDAEIANFSAAWAWDAHHGLWELHRSTLASLRQFFTESGRASEGRALFAMLADALRSDPDRPQDLLAATLEALGWFQMLSGDVTEARNHLNEAQALSHGGDAEARAQVLRTLGALQLVTGEIEEAAANFNAGLELIAGKAGPLAASLQYDLAQAHHYRGARDQATSAARLALQAGRASNNWVVTVRSYLLLADIEVESHPKRAIVLLNEGWVIAKEASLDHLAIYFPHILGLAHLNLREAEIAEKYFADGMQAAHDVGQLTTVCANYVGRAEARLMREETDDAIDDLKTGIRLALKTDSGRYLMWAAIVSCRAATAGHAPTAATKELLTLALRHPATDQDARDKAVESWRDLFNEAPEPSRENATEGDAVGLDEIAERSLELLTLR